MPTSASDAAGTPKEISSQLIELPLVSKNKTPKEGWENATKGACPSCGAEVWMLPSILTAMADTHFRAACSTCINDERDRQGRP